MNRNPDGNFVLHGRQTPISFDKPKDYLTNSQRTISTRNLSQTTLYRPDSQTSTRDTLRSSHSTPKRRQNKEHSSRKHEETDSVFDAESLFGSMNGGTEARKQRRERSLFPRDSELSLDLTNLSNSLSKSLNKSVSFSEHLIHTNGSKYNDEDELDDSFEDELHKLIEEDRKENQRFEEDLAGKPKSREESQWFTGPVHLTKDSEYPIFQSLGIDIPRVSPVNRTAGMIGTEIAQRKIANQMHLDDFTRSYFPVTLGEMPSIMRTVTPQPPNSVSKKYARAQSAKESRNKSGRSSSTMRSNSTFGQRSGRSSVSTYDDPKASALYDYNYLRASQPLVDQTVSVTPYQYELAQLKMERLRLEEQRMLESKRQEELERIRGPTPKWYELKTPQFTYEMHKNNKLWESKKDWQSLMDYREQLSKSSKDFSQTNLGGSLY
ncbi:uncharacterized protein [Asterias amurensis]|uniref:uncharacterized protein n=1 Tax=Asterias amurensis TaxID=7602 RepID=UPI003AB24A28